MKKEKLFRFGIIGLFIAFVFVIVSSFAVFFQRNAERVEQTNLYYLEQDSGRLCGQIDSELEIGQNYLRNIASIFADSSIDNLEEMQLLLEKMAEESPFDNLYFTYPDGTSYRFSGENKNVFEREYFQKALKGESGITEPIISKMTGKEIIVFYHPVQKNNSVCAVLLGVLFTDNIADKLKTTFMDESVYSAIISADGQILIGSNSRLNGKNLLEEIQKWEVFGEDSVETMKNKMAQRKSGLLSYKGLEDTSLVIYRPLGKNSWYIIQNLPSAILSNMKGAISTAAVHLAIALSVGFFLLFLALFLWFRKRYGDLYVENQRVGAIIASSYNLIMEYDVQEKRTTWYGDSEKIFMTDKNQMDLTRMMDAAAWAIFKKQIEDIKNDKAYSVELQLKNHEGVMVWCNCRLIAIKNLNGDIIRILGIVRNIDEEKKKEFALIDEKDRMEESYRTELERALEEAREANSIKSSFLKYISHDLRTPMNAVIGMNKLSSKALKEGDIQKAEFYVERTRSAANYLMSLISGILEMVHFQKSQISLKEEPFSFEGIVNDCKDFFHYVSQKRQISLVIENKVSGKYLGDFMRICQILNNLLENAVKFNKPDGTVRLQITASRRDEERDELQIVVSDTGIGMDDMQMKRLFEPFSRGTMIPSEVESGTGIGLAIVKHIVDAMDGKIHVESRKGEGTTVHLMLPIKRIAADYTAFSKRIKEKEKITVLVVDDIEINLEIAATLISGEGYQVMTAGNGREALELFANSPTDSIDIILTDISMPEMDGYELAKAIRGLERKDARSVYIMALSAFDYEESGGKAKESGMNAFLNKPFDMKQFSQIIKAET